MKQIIYAFAKNTVFANILLILIFLAGGFACFSMLKETFPPMDLEKISITVPYPGADPEEVEEGISRKIEEAIESLEGIDEYTTNSSENIATVIIEVDKGYDTGDVLESVRANVDAISNFPVDAENPIIKEVVMKDTVVTLYLSSDMPERRLKQWGERIKDRIKLLPEVSQVSISGVREYEISIEVSEAKLRQYNLSFAQVADAVKKSSLNRAGGTLRAKGEEIRIRTMGRKYTGDDFAKIIVLAKPTGEIVTLGRVADIVDGFDENPSRAFINGQRSVLITVSKTEEEDAITISDAVHKFAKKNDALLPRGVTLKMLYDRTDMLRARIDLLVKNGAFGLCIVFILLWAFLNTRLSLWVGMGIPISLAGALSILWAIGGSINMISLFGLILVLGIVVDDAIVVGESIYVHRQNNKPPLKAAVEGTMEVAMPVVAAVLTSVVAFIPLAYVGGTMGKFISILPPVVISCLAVSLIECLVLLPAHLSHLPDPAKNSQAKGISGFLKKTHLFTSHGMEWFINTIYTPFLSKALRWRYISLCIAISLLLIIMGIMKGGLIKFNVFPEIDGFIVTSSVVFPNGTPASITEKAVQQLEESLARMAEKTKTISQKPLVEKKLSFIGGTSSRRGSSTTGSNAGMVQAILLESEERGIHSRKIMALWEKETGPIPGAESVSFETMGPGKHGSPLAFWIQGENMENVLFAADQLMAKLKRFDGVYQVESDFSPGKKELQLTLKPWARNLDLTVADLASQVNSAYYGNEALRVQRGEDDVRVKIRYTAEERGSMESLENMRIRTPMGYEVPLSSVADMIFQPGYSTITRTNGMRRVSVSAGVNISKANTNEIFDELTSSFFKELEARYPDLKIVLQGDKKRSMESFSSLMIGFPLALVGIFALVATMFRSYLQPFIIMFTIPFGIIGAVLGHMAMDYNLSIMSVFGMVALTGVVVNDAIVLIEKINVNLAEGNPFFDSILQGGTRRFRAIFLTTFSTIGGLAPMLLETDLQARFLIPMAISLAAGVAFATILTLVLIPSLFVILSDFRLVFHKIRYGWWPKRVDVEPAKQRF
ncbi:MAG: efflux RND transporter permease subunit [Thermodesulfobacteriota bacterium]|nr:efflux RND transporter permease subunit [Thermodesulfobacteriota bacterium]